MKNGNDVKSFLSPIFAGAALFMAQALVVNPAFAQQSTEQGQTEEAENSDGTLQYSDQIALGLGPATLDYLQQMQQTPKIALLNAHDFGGGTITPEELKEYLAEHDMLVAEMTDLHLTELADSLNHHNMAAQKVVDAQTKQTQICLVSVGVLGRGTLDHITELSSIPADLIENIDNVGTADNWQAAKLMHEFAHCAQPYQRKTAFTYVVTIGIEIDADQQMFDILVMDAANVSKDFLKAYRAARSIASVHFTSVTHHTNAALFLPDEHRPDPEITAQMIFDQTNVIKTALAEQVSLITARNDLLTEAIVLQQADDDLWKVKDEVLQNNPDLIEDATRLKPSEFFEKYDDQNSRFTGGVKKHLAELIKSERTTYETYRTFYLAAKALITENEFQDNAYAVRFLNQYIEGVELFMPSVRQPPQQQVLATVHAY